MAAQRPDLTGLQRELLQHIQYGEEVMRGNVPGVKATEEFVREHENNILRLRGLPTIDHPPVGFPPVEGNLFERERQRKRQMLARALQNG